MTAIIALFPVGQPIQTVYWPIQTVYWPFLPCFLVEKLSLDLEKKSVLRVIPAIGVGRHQRVYIIHLFLSPSFFQSPYSEE